LDFLGLTRKQDSLGCSLQIRKAKQGGFEVSHVNYKVSLRQSLFVWFAVIFLLALGCAIPYFFSRPDPAPTFDPNPPSRSGPGESFIDLPSFEQTPYRRGFDAGYYAFMAQVGRHSDVPKTILKNASIANSETFKVYTSSDSSGESIHTELDADSPEWIEYDAGYVDGYHKATAKFSCPR
jgi:hypothetical protein